MDEREKQLFEQIMKDLMDPFVEEEKLVNIYKLFLSESFQTIFNDELRETITYYFEMLLTILKIQNVKDMKEMLKRFFCQKNKHANNTNEMVFMLMNSNMHKLAAKSFKLEFHKNTYKFDDLKRTNLYKNLLVEIARDNGFDKVEDYIKHLES